MSIIISIKNYEPNHHEGQNCLGGCYRALVFFVYKMVPDICLM